MSEMNYFAELNSINVGDKIEKKNGLSYLSWAWAWAELKKRHPDAQYTIYENSDGWNYFTDGQTAWVKTGVTVNGLEHIEYLPVMDFRNKSIPLKSITSFEVNKTIQRSLTKAVARHGLGLYIYAGEDLPEDDNAAPEPVKPSRKAAKNTDADLPFTMEYRCADCGKPFEPFTSKTGETWSAEQVFMMAVKKNPDGKARCKSCREKLEGVL